MVVQINSADGFVASFALHGTTATDSFKAWVVRFLELPTDFKHHLMAMDCITELRKEGYRVEVLPSI